MKGELFFQDVQDFEKTAVVFSTEYPGESSSFLTSDSAVYIFFSSQSG